MPTIDRSLLSSVVYLYPNPEAARTGESGASGFLLSVPSEIPGAVFVYAVTNWHVVAQGCTTIRTADRRAGEHRWIVERGLGDWVHEPGGDDLAVTPLWLGRAEPNYLDDPLSYVPLEWCATAEDFVTAAPEEAEREPRVWAFGPGDDVFMVGRFLGHDGTEENRPAVRFGSVAISPPVGVEQPACADEPAREQESFVLECRSLSGFSGSPVFVYRGRATWGAGQLPVGLEPKYGPRLLGIDWGNLDRVGTNTYAIDWGAPTEPATTGQPLRFPSISGMMCAVPAWKLTELMGRPELRDFQRVAEDSHRREVAASGATLDRGVEPAEFNAFADLTRKLLRVPKAELDQERRREQR